MEKDIEIQCILHTQCNLACKFCFETDNGIRKPATINIDYIKSLPGIIIESIKPNLNNNSVSLFLMGGELFSDNISDEIFESYDYFISTLTERLLSEFKVNIVINLVSNGIFTNYERVEKLIVENNTGLILSYDACDRFANDTQRSMWLATYNYFKDKDINLWVSTVLTKKNTNAYISGEKIFNDIIPTDILIELDDYSPRLDYHEYLMNDEDYYNFYKHCLDNGKFNVFHINIIMKCYVEQKYIPTCTYGLDYVFSEDLMETDNAHYIRKCLEQTSLSKEEYYGDQADAIKDAHNCSKYKQPLGIAKRGCLYCEYNGACPTMCWDLVLFKEYKITECPIKRVYQYIDDNQIIVDKYKEWVDIHGEKI